MGAEKVQEGDQRIQRFSKTKAGGERKTNQKGFLKYRCTVCKKSVQPPAFRSKKFEIVEVKG
jgi:Ribosomal protein L44.